MDKESSGTAPRAPATWKCRRDGLCTSEWIAANRAGGSCGKLDSPAASGRPQISHTRREPRRSLGHKRLRNAAGARRCEYWTSRFSAPAILLQAIKLPPYSRKGIFDAALGPTATTRTATTSSPQTQRQTGSPPPHRHPLLIYLS